VTRTIAGAVLATVVGESTLAGSDGRDASKVPPKEEKELEKALLRALTPILKERAQLGVPHQTAVAHALQIVCFNNKFPRGLMLRLAMELYDLDVVEEEAWMRWREDLTDEFPGKVRCRATGWSP